VTNVRIARSVVAFIQDDREDGTVTTEAAIEAAKIGHNERRERGDLAALSGGSLNAGDDAGRSAALRRLDSV
jgi:hypothetical protein